MPSRRTTSANLPTSSTQNEYNKVRIDSHRGFDIYGYRKYTECDQHTKVIVMVIIYDGTITTNFRSCYSRLGKCSWASILLEGK